MIATRRKKRRMQHIGVASTFLLFFEELKKIKIVFVCLEYKSDTVCGDASTYNPQRSKLI